METTTWRCPQAPEPLLEWLHAEMSNTKGVESVTRLQPNTLQVRAGVYPGWVVAVAILFFPLGLLALLVGRQYRTLLFRVEPDDKGSLLTISGATVPNTQKALLRLWKALEPGGVQAVHTPSPLAAGA